MWQERYWSRKRQGPPARVGLDVSMWMGTQTRAGGEGLVLPGSTSEAALGSGQTQKEVLWIQCFNQIKHFIPNEITFFLLHFWVS